MTVADKHVSVVYTYIYRVSDGKIIENWALGDALSVVEQLGMKLTLEQ
jgi:predicted ester cyclase